MTKKYQSGFTLIEILVVVVIISILTVLGVQMVSSGSVERNLQQHGRILQSTIEYSCDQATLQNIPHGLKLSKNSYIFAQYVNQQWLDLPGNQGVFARQYADGSFFSLEIDGREIVLKKDEIELPQIMCDSSGQLTAFNLTISDATNLHHYQLKTTGFWQMQGQWLDADRG
jgi:general secretion pathway protein H